MGSGFRVSDFGFIETDNSAVKVVRSALELSQGLGFRVQGLRVLGFRVYVLWFTSWALKVVRPESALVLYVKSAGPPASVVYVYSPPACG